MTDSDDPFKPSDLTVPRPRPGAGRRGAADAPPPRATMTAAYVEPLPAHVRDGLGIGLNPLVQAATPLFVLAGHLRSTLSVTDVAALRRQALEDIKRFEDRARDTGIHGDVIVAARYVLCAALDEAALATPWGAQSEWAQQSLLVTLHREAWGGAKFFELLEGLSRDVSRHIDLLELQYLCLAFGFAGKHHRDPVRLAEVERDLYRRIRDHRGAPQPELSPRWRGLEDRRNPIVRYVPWWVVGAACLAILVIAFIIYHARLGGVMAPVQAQLARVGVEAFDASPVVAAAPPGPTLKQLLASDEASGVMRVEEEGGRTLITLLAGDLFASGSATANAKYLATLQRLAQTMGQLPGRVLVVGHTDDQPVRSLRYADNFALSRERAVSVAQVLQAASPGRVEWTGAGSSEPRYRPESTPGNRGRNRRVEIVHVRGS